PPGGDQPAHGGGRAGAVRVAAGPGTGPVPPAAPAARPRRRTGDLRRAAAVLGTAAAAPRAVPAGADPRAGGHGAGAAAARGPGAAAGAGGGHQGRRRGPGRRRGGPGALPAGRAAGRLHPGTARRRPPDPGAAAGRAHIAAPAAGAAPGADRLPLRRPAGQRRAADPAVHLPGRAPAHGARAGCGVAGPKVAPPTADSTREASAHCADMPLQEQTMSSTPVPSTGEFLTFTLGEENYGADILKVQVLRVYDSVSR